MVHKCSRNNIRLAPIVDDKLVHLVRRTPWMQSNVSTRYLILLKCTAVSWSQMKHDFLLQQIQQRANHHKQQSRPHLLHRLQGWLVQFVPRPKAPIILNRNRLCIWVILLCSPRGCHMKSTLRHWLFSTRVNRNESTGLLIFPPA